MRWLLARLMAGAPSLDGSDNGHRSHSPHNVVVTVNFDNLIAEALVLYEKRYSVVCGHEVMAAEIHPAEEIPLIVKLHADLMLRPRSRPQDIRELASPWKELIRRFGRSHRFIFLGYGGNDPGFMGFLASELKPGELEYEPWWGYYTPDPKQPDEGRRPGNCLVSNFLNTHQGTLFPVPTFDLMMHALLEDTSTPHPNQTDVRHMAEEIVEFFERGQKNLILEQNVEMVGTMQSKQSRDMPDTFEQQASSKVPEMRGMKSQGRSAQEWVLRALAAPSVAEAVVEFEAGLVDHPNDHLLRCSYAVFLQNKRLSPERVAELYAQIPLKLLHAKPDREDAWWLGNYAVFLKNQGRFDDADRFYKRAMEADPLHANNLGNYALFLWKQNKQFKDAESYFERALEADRKHASNLVNYAGY